MLMTAVEAHGFRNIEGGIEPGPSLNVLWGSNAAGKTSLLEAIYTLANTKSFRTSALRDAINFDSQDAVVRATILRGSVERELRMYLAGARKDFFVNGKSEPTVEYIAHLDTVDA